MHTPTESIQGTYTTNHVTFSSSFDSGNLLSANYQPSLNEFHLTTAKDGEGTPYETPYTTWFHFSVSDVCEGDIIKMCIGNMNKQLRLYKQDYRPFCKVVPLEGTKVDKEKGQYMNVWRRIPSVCSIKVVGKGAQSQMQLRFSYKFEALGRSTSSSKNTDVAEGKPCGYKVFFSFCYPQGYTELQKRLEECDCLYGGGEKGFYYHRELLTTSLDGRRIDLLTITSNDGIRDDCEMPFKFTPMEARGESSKRFDFRSSGKKIVFISSRVHPGETPAQHVFDGCLNFLLSNDVRARQLRRQFVFKMVPMLNPDGVARGHYRCDSRGVNLNRFYDEPDPVQHPSIYAVKAFLERKKDDLRLYLDLHAHASKRGCFIYGNYLPSPQGQLANQMYPKLISQNSQWFEYKGCDFSLKGMSGKDKRDNGLTKGGSGRVGIYYATANDHCYTLECNYNEGLLTGPIGNCGGFGGTPAGNLMGGVGRMTTPKYTIEMFQNVGEACCVALLDMGNTNPLSRLGGEIPSRNERKSGLKGTFTAPTFEEVAEEIRREVCDRRDLTKREFEQEALGGGEREEEEDTEEAKRLSKLSNVANDVRPWSKLAPNWHWGGVIEVSQPLPTSKQQQRVKKNGTMQTHTKLKMKSVKPTINQEPTKTSAFNRPKVIARAPYRRPTWPHMEEEDTPSHLQTAAAPQTQVLFQQKQQQLQQQVLKKRLPIPQPPPSHAHRKINSLPTDSTSMPVISRPNRMFNTNGTGAVPRKSMEKIIHGIGSKPSSLGNGKASKIPQPQFFYSRPVK